MAPNANVAQLAEQVIRNDQVDGSNPPVGSSLRPKAREGEGCHAGDRESLPMILLPPANFVLASIRFSVNSSEYFFHGDNALPYRVFNLEQVAVYLHLPVTEVKEFVRTREIPCEMQGDRLVFRKK